MDVLESLRGQPEVATPELDEVCIGSRDEVASPARSSTRIGDAADAINVILVPVHVELEPLFQHHESTKSLVQFQEDHINEQRNAEGSDTHKNLGVGFR